jgi:hypothetical protein
MRRERRAICASGIIRIILMRIMEGMIILVSASAAKGPGRE